MPRRHEEDDLQMVTAKFLDACLTDECIWWHTPNGGRRNAREAARLKAMGTRAGVPDICILYRQLAHFIELKVGKNGLTDSQKDTIPKIERAGCPVTVARSIEDVQSAVLKWNLPLRGRIV